ncbi:MAG: prolipoprotein diacylglyceryl transferase [Bacteroidetes bacterium]|jgi:prolipoprotein diacylglyceryl transferase|nr:prolipoprotein diacylglyceryl transferase [Bacteroidota bacterium]
MSNHLLYTLWNVAPEMFTIPGIDWPVRWYGFLFAMAFVGSQFVMNKVYKTELRPQKHLDILTLYIILGTVLGARLGHMIFYEPKTLLENPLEVVKIWNGGLASHGGAIGILIAMWLYCRKTKENWRWIFDRLIIVVALSGMCIRTGNLMNSEIIGKPTDSSIGVVFINPMDGYLKEKLENIKDIHYNFANRDTVIQNTPVTAINMTVDIKEAMPPGHAAVIAEEIGEYSTYLQGDERHVLLNNADLISSTNKTAGTQFKFTIYGVPRHAAQMYEAFYCLFLFILFFWLWKYKRDKFPQLFLFGLFCVLLFTERFFDEMLKENQVGFEDNMGLNMGQILSIPFVLAGIIMMIWSKRKNIYHQLPPAEKEKEKNG